MPDLVANIIWTTSTKLCHHCQIKKSRILFFSRLECVIVLYANWVVPCMKFTGSTRSVVLNEQRRFTDDLDFLYIFALRHITSLWLNFLTRSVCFPTHKSQHCLNSLLLKQSKYWWSKTAISFGPNWVFLKTMTKSTGEYMLTSSHDRRIAICSLFWFLKTLYLSRHWNLVDKLLFYMRLLCSIACSYSERFQVFRKTDRS